MEKGKENVYKINRMTELYTYLNKHIHTLATLTKIHKNYILTDDTTV